jgi:probable F420-dependent oxidoreductase
MQLGIVFPQSEIGNDPQAIRDFAQGAEGLGFSHMLVYDHVLGADPSRPGGWRGPYDMNTPFHEPFVLFGHLAAVTRRIELCTTVLILPQRQTALVAKQAAEVDVLSGGRLRLGIGTGWNQIEYEALNENFKNRGRRQEEQVELMRLLWSKDSVDYQGKYHRVTLAGINPRPTRPIPIWFGGSADALIERAARIGDGWFPLMAANDAAREAVTKLRSCLKAVGRDPAAFPIEPQAQVRGGDPDRWRKHIDAWRELGATHMSIATMNASLRGVDGHLRAASRWLETVRG